MSTRQQALASVLIVLGSALSLFFVGPVPLALGEPLNPLSLTKYIDPLFIPPLAQPTTPGGTDYEIGVFPVGRQVHSQLPPTDLWAYGTSRETATWPGPSIVATRGIPIHVRWTNHLVDAAGNPLPHPLPVDQTLHWADPLNQGHLMERYTGPVPIAVHVHGAEVEPQSDGGPETWFTPDFAIKGADWRHEVYEYANTQPATTLFYHDHALGITRENVYMGLAGAYVVTDPGNEPEGLPTGQFDIPLVLQDRLFKSDGQLDYPEEGINPEHPFWVPEVFGNVMVVNGRAWPYLEVQPRKYRFRFVNGSSARFYSLRALERTGGSGPAFVQISSDGGYLAAPVILNDPGSPNSPRLLLAPGERADVVIDFAAYAPGTRLVLTNNAKAPFPKGEPADPATVGQIMEFRVVSGTPDGLVLPQVLNTIPVLGSPALVRTLTLNEVMGEEGPLAMFLDGKMWETPVTEVPVLGSTELWQVVNLTADTHPIHLHLVQFQLLNRQAFRSRQYLEDYERLNPVIPAEETINPPVEMYLRGQPKPPDLNERGWKDTIRMNPGEVSRILVRFAPHGEAGVTPYAFDAAAEPGYVWHCHITDHEDNEMMRRLRLTAGAAPAPFQPPAGALVEKTGTAGAPAFVLEQNSPNPFLPSTRITFSVPSAGPANLSVFDVQGRLVRTLVAGELSAGPHSALWDGRDASGHPAPSGVYSYRLRAGGREAVRRLMRLE